MLLAQVIPLCIILAVLGLNQVFAKASEDGTIKSDQLHPVGPGTPTPTPPRKYFLPFNRNQKSVITNGPGEGDHTNRSAEAIDFAPRPTGSWTELRAAKGGTAYINDFYNNSWGNLLVIQHGDGFYTYYAHLANRSPIGVGTPVAKGQVIGTMGSTGNSTGLHLHFEARDSMSNNNPGTGDSTNHPPRPLRGHGWFPWCPHPDMNSGFTMKSTSHPLGVCLSNPQITMEWLAPNEFVHTINRVEQLDGYSYAFTQNPNDVPDLDKDVEENVYTLTSNPLPLGSTEAKWYFHLRAKMNDPNPYGGWASDAQVAHQGPYTLALGCPRAPSPSDWDDTAIEE